MGIILVNTHRGMEKNNEEENNENNYENEEGISLVEKINEEARKNGIALLALGTSIDFPRDSLHFYEDGHFDYVNPIIDLRKYSLSHEAFHGGKFLLGDDFVIFSDSMNKRIERTAEMLGKSRYVIFPVNEIKDLFSEISVAGSNKFYKSNDFGHIDPYFNLSNKYRKLFYYDLIEEYGRALAKEINYDPVALPMEDSHFASIGFVELGDYVLVDERAETTKEILHDLGYKLITGNFKETNKRGASIRCITKEMPYNILRIKKLVMPEENYEKLFYAIENGKILGNVEQEAPYKIKLP